MDTGAWQAPVHGVVKSWTRLKRRSSSSSSSRETDGASLVAQIKESACNVGDVGLIPGLGRFPGGGHGNPLQYSCLENPTDRGAWRTAVCGVAKSCT